MRFYRKRRKSRKPVEWERDDSIRERMVRLVIDLEIDWVLPDSIHTFRSYNSTSNAIARIWGLNKVWQMALESEPKYILEVIAERFDNLSEREKDEVILHELAHIPRNFSGALMAHSHGKGAFHDKLDKFIHDYRRK
ncbi:MAG TPA: putative metallopeptidase [Candidatus Saccharimonadales bacterium]|nr:putative metallopeptidase [Candidatus Saccharimonadales bacterium]